MVFCGAFDPTILLDCPRSTRRGFGAGRSLPALSLHPVKKEGGSTPSFPEDSRPSALEYVGQGDTDPGRRFRHPDAGGLHRRDLVLGTALTARDYGTSMTHGAALGSGEAGDEPRHRLLAALLRLVDEELRRILLGRTADLADHDDRLGGLVGQEHLEHVA